jgi:hypothetical protein
MWGDIDVYEIEFNDDCEGESEGDWSGDNTLDKLCSSKFLEEENFENKRSIPSPVKHNGIPLHANNRKIMNKKKKLGWGRDVEISIFSNSVFWILLLSEVCNSSQHCFSTFKR